MHKVPFIHQVTEYDCVPATFVNALLYLFRREEIPPVVLQKIYLTCLDSTAGNRLGRGGTSSAAQEVLEEWLNEYAENRFRVKTTSCFEGDVTFRKQSGKKATGPISKLSRKGGKEKSAVAIIAVTDGRYMHAILGLGVSKDYGSVYCFDPYRSLPDGDGRKRYTGWAALTLGESEEYWGANIRIECRHLNQTRNGGHYHLGPREDRMCTFIKRISR